MSFKESLQAEAFSLGFTFIGATSPEPPPHLAAFERWLTAGRHGAMAYLASDQSLQRRAQPYLILPECRSVFILAARYPSPLEMTLLPTREMHGRVAAFAWVDDYHEILINRLQSLIDWIEHITGHQVRWRGYTDTGPILERELAQRAGLGWIGKNTCLISPIHGSFFFLAEIFTDLQLEYDSPFTADRCGTCKRCIESCPTGCILPDRTLDATRCISYLTIENKGPIPTDLRPLIGNWIFGCDICQMVCPWNLHSTQPINKPIFISRPNIPQPVLSRELRLTPQEFSHKFRRSSIKRTHRRGYLRNVAVALGNSGNPDAVPDLAQSLEMEAEALVRSHAAWALGQIGTVPARQALEKARQRDSDLNVNSEIEMALDR